MQKFSLFVKKRFLRKQKTIMVNWWQYIIFIAYSLLHVNFETINSFSLLMNSLPFSPRPFSGGFLENLRWMCL